ncbi:MAG: diguanylate cyclase [Desulfocapsaceae bacterium]|nr:diguanylate cyclase [Desulfocapsaceae bacterium]
MGTRIIFDQFNETGKLPSPSLTVLKLMGMAREGVVTPEAFMDLMETDHETARDLREYTHLALLVPDRRGPQSLHLLATGLDIRIIVLLALGFSLLNRHREGKCRGFDYVKFWSVSLARAVAARAIAQMQNSFNPDELFICGLLAQMGSLALADIFPEEYDSLISTCTNEQEMLIREKELFGITHLELSAEILHGWGLQEKHSLVVRFHENPNPYNFPDQSSFEIARLLYLAFLLSKILFLEVPLLEKLNHAELLAEQYNISQSEFGPFFDKLSYHCHEWNQVLRFPPRPISSYNQIMAEEGLQAGQQPSHYDKRKIRILAVDDDPLTLIRLRKTLSGADKEILTACDGEDALRVALRDSPHMVITDWRMPKMDGLELCRILRRTSLTQHIYIVMLTNYKSDDDLVLAFETGVDDFITKPFTPKVLEARIHSGERLIRYQKTISHDREVIQRYAAQLTSANRQLETMAMTDPLTGLPNRRSAMNRLDAAAAETLRHGERLSCIMIDIDHFKTVNDTFGHESGDLVLKAIATTFHRKARIYDTVSRTGGEEFLVICARSDIFESQQLAERLRQAIADLRVDLGKGFVQVTISLGVATWRPEFTDSDALIRAADKAMYKAKSKGRNRVELADP